MAITTYETWAICRFAFLDGYAAYVGSWKPKFWDKSVPSSRVNQHRKHSTPRQNLKSLVVTV